MSTVSITFLLLSVLLQYFHNSIYHIDFYSLGMVLHCNRWCSKIGHGISHSHSGDRNPIIDNDTLAQQDVENNRNNFNTANTENDNINVKAALIHVIGDFVQSCGVLIAAIVIYFRVNTFK